MPASMTPMMRSIELKDKTAMSAVFPPRRLYEMFFEDAKTAAKNWTRADGPRLRPERARANVRRAVSRGGQLHRQAHRKRIQSRRLRADGDPALAKGLVERDVIRIITPGTVIEDRMLEEGQEQLHRLHLDGGQRHRPLRMRTYPRANSICCNSMENNPPSRAG